MAKENNRKFYRIQYHQPGESPLFKVSGEKFEVKDLSEEGARINTHGVSGFRAEAPIAGTMTFPDNESFLISGEILRVTGSDIVIRFKKGFPLRKIADEQRRLIQKTKQD